MRQRRSSFSHNLDFEQGGGYDFRQSENNYVALMPIVNQDRQLRFELISGTYFRNINLNAEC